MIDLNGKPLFGHLPRTIVMGRITVNLSTETVNHGHPEDQ
jgi:hypothetical protein